MILYLDFDGVLHIEVKVTSSTKAPTFALPRLEALLREFPHRPTRVVAVAAEFSFLALSLEFRNGTLWSRLKQPV